MSIAFLGLGSNINASFNIGSGIAGLRKSFNAVELSPAYRAQAVGFSGKDFINLVASVETDLPPLQLKALLTALEDEHGRNRKVPKFSDRTLDVDILLYDDLYLLSPELEIPREEILTAAYVLKPLADLAPQMLHPVSRKTMTQLWQDFPNKQTHLKPVDLP